MRHRMVDRGVCWIDKCPCGAFHLHYRHVVVRVGAFALLRIMEECYSREREGALLNEHGHPKPFGIMIGVVSLRVPWREFPLFSQVVQDTVADEIGLPALAAALGFSADAAE